MLRVFVRRLALAVPILLGVTVIIYVLMTVLPGDPAQAFLAEDATPEERAEIRRTLGLDRPFVVRYLSWLGDVFAGDLGWSPYRRREVLSLIGQAWSNTVVLALASAALGLIGGSVLGTIAALRRGKLADRVISFFCLTGLSVPSFFLAIVMLIIFSVELGWLPSAGTGQDEGFVSFLHHLIMPMIAGSLATLAVTSRVTRASVIETYGADFVQTMRAKGLSESQVLKRVAKNAVSPVLTTSGLQIGNLLGGAVLIETIFRWPGVGTLVYNAITARDLLVVQGATLVIALTFVLMNLLVDVAQAAVDPRLRSTIGAT